VLIPALFSNIVTAITIPTASETIFVMALDGSKELDLIYFSLSPLSFVFFSLEALGHNIFSSIGLIHVKCCSDTCEML
jgi:hypothetical protein